MTREELEQLMAAKLYGELKDDQCRPLDEWLDHHPEDRQEFNELQKTHALLSRLKDIPASVVPLRAETLAVKKPSRGYWRRWAGALAACFVLGLLCSWRGFAFQVGPVRLAFGPAVDETALRKEITQEMAATYVPIFKTVAATLGKMRDDVQLTAQRQDNLEQTVEQTVQVMTALRNVDKEMDNRRLEKYTNDLGRKLDERMKYIARPVVYNPQEFTNSNPMESPK